MHSWIVTVAKASRVGIVAAGAFIAVGAAPVDAVLRDARQDTIVRVVQNPVHPGIAGLVQELSIGVVDGDPDYILSSVSDVLPLRDGSLLILELSSGAGLIRQYGSDGKYIRTIGRTGKGPGEHTAPTGLGQLPDGRIVVGDTQNGRVNVYSEDGQSADTWVLIGYRPVIGGRDWLRIHTAGIVYLKFLLPPDRSTVPPTSESAILRLDSGGTIIDTVFQPKLPEPGPPRFRVVRNYAGGGRGYSSPRVAYLPVAWPILSPLGYFVTFAGNRYAIDVRLPRASRTPANPAPLWQQGDPVVSIRRNVSPVPVSARERRDQGAYITDWIARANGRVEGTVPDIPSQKPFLKNIVVGEDGRIWAEISTPSEQYDPEPRFDRDGAAIPEPHWREPTAYDVYEPNGRYLGQVTVPYDTWIRRAQGDVVWAVARDALDVETVKRYRINWRN